jgi:hypothetical protein
MGKNLIPFDYGQYSSKTMFLLVLADLVKKSQGYTHIFFTILFNPSEKESVKDLVCILVINSRNILDFSF